VVFVASAGKPTADQVRAVELELAGIGYVLSARLRGRLALTSLDELAGFRAWALATLLALAGGDQKHEPLFRKFPKGIPSDTEELYWTKVLVHFLQADDRPCLTCMQRGTTHVLDPCKHVVCDRCFDGASCRGTACRADRRSVRAVRGRGACRCDRGSASACPAASSARGHRRRS
jgi:hypothetical protein